MFTGGNPMKNTTSSPTCYAEHAFSVESYVLPAVICKNHVYRFSYRGIYWLLSDDELFIEFSTDLVESNKAK